jgi:hypothetical protein
VILRVNQEYIKSAAQADEYRTEPPFQLQGSYRNMNRIAERVSPVMNDQELKTLILSQYEQDAGTLTTGAEANLLKFKELRGWLSEKEAERWESIKRTFQQNLKMRGIDTSDRFGQVVAQMSVFGDGLDGIRQTLSGGLSKLELLARSHDGNGQPVQATFAPEAMELLTNFVAELQLATASRTAGPPLPEGTGMAGLQSDESEEDKQIAARESSVVHGNSGQPYRVEVVNRVSYSA